MNKLIPTQVPVMYKLMSSADAKRFIVMSVLLFWCACMIAVRINRTGSGYYLFLLGNLFLASVPLFFSTALRIATHLRLHWTMRLAVFCLWLLFLPNAPYILTDILHLTRASQAPAWYDLALLLVFRNRFVVGLPVTHRRANYSSSTVRSRPGLDLCNGVAGAEWICDLSRQVPALEQLGRFDRADPSL
jgi:Protein of unknown function (DUF1361)